MADRYQRRSLPPGYRATAQRRGWHRRRIRDRNALLLVTGQRPENIALCYFLTILVAASYWAGQRQRIIASVRSGDWRRLLSDMLG